MKLLNQKSFANGIVYLLETEDGYPVEVTDTFLPYYTKDAIGRKQNALNYQTVGDRAERWMIGVSCMSGCPVHCEFCATGKLKKWRALRCDEILEQIAFVLDKNPQNFGAAKEHKINYTRMGEPFYNIEEVKKTVDTVSKLFPKTHHYISTIGIKNSDFSWIKGNITLQVSLHSLDEAKRNKLIPLHHKMTIEELGRIRTQSNLKTTVNMTLIDESDFDIESLKKYFDPKYFFIKLSPVNKNECFDKDGFVQGINLI